MTTTDDTRPAEPVSFGPHEVCTLAGVTYRQLDYWLRANLIPGDTAHGSGSQRRFTQEQVDYISTFAKLVDAGLEHKRAAEAMTTITAAGTVRLSPYIVLVLDEAVDG